MKYELARDLPTINLDDFVDILMAIARDTGTHIHLVLESDPAFAEMAGERA